jgi:hypothetical protein
MEIKSYSSTIASLARLDGIDSDRVQPIVFLAQKFGEQLGYFFDVHHFRVFSLRLQKDVESIAMESSASTDSMPKLLNLLAEKIRAVPIEQAEIAAAYFYFEEKGYSADEIERSLNAEASVMSGAKRLVAELTKLGSKSLVGSGIS